MFTSYIKKAPYRLLAVFFSILLWMPASLTASAASTAELQLQISQKIHTENNGEPIQNTFFYSLIPLAPDFPMPENTEGDYFSFTITGNATYTLPPIDFHKSGIYSYQLKQNIPSSSNGILYDKRIYRIDFYIENDTSGFKPPLLVITEEGSDKVDHIIFENTVSETDRPKPDHPETDHDHSDTDSSQSVRNDSSSSASDKTDLNVPPLPGSDTGTITNQPASSQTGDNAPILFLTILIFVSVSGILFLIRRRRR